MALALTVVAACTRPDPTPPGGDTPRDRTPGAEPSAVRAGGDAATAAGAPTRAPDAPPPDAGRSAPEPGPTPDSTVGRVRVFDPTGAPAAGVPLELRSAGPDIAMPGAGMPLRGGPRLLARYAAERVATTDAEGRARFAVDGTERRVLTASTDVGLARLDWDPQAYLRSGAPELTLGLVPTYTLRGRVRWASSDTYAPLGDVRLELAPNHDTPDSAVAPKVSHVRVESDGAFTVTGLPAGAYDARAESRRSPERLCGGVVTVSVPARERVEVVVQPAVAVAGRVTGPPLAWVRGTEVDLTFEVRAGRSGRLKTQVSLGPDGHFETGGLCPGHHSVVASVRGGLLTRRATAELTVSDRAPAAVTLDFSSDAMSASGPVSPAGGASGAAADPGPDPDARAPEDASPLPPVYRAVRVTAGDAPARDAVVWWRCAGDTEPRGARVGPDGEAVAALLGGEGPCDVEAESPAGDASVRLGREAAAGGPLELALRPRPRVSGRLVDAHGGEPLVGVRVTFVSGAGRSSDPVLTDAAGHFAGALAPGGDVWLSALAPETLTPWRVSVVPAAFRGAPRRHARPLHLPALAELELGTLELEPAAP